MNANIIIVGVGGQGILLSSRILGKYALDAGLECKVSEVHGMAQRGGSVITHVRVGTELHSPLVAPGEADYVIAFETLEALRAEYFLKPDGILIMNTQKITPMPVILGTQAYPEQPPKAARVVSFDALKVAKESFDARAVNITLLGALSARMGGAQDAWEKAIAACVPQKTLEGNLRAYRAGRLAGGEK